MRRKKRNKRLYYPTKSKWYRRPKRRKPSVRRRNRWAKGGFKKSISKWIKGYLIWVLVAAAFGVAIIFLSFSSYFSIKDIEILREDFNIDSAAIENDLNEFIGRNIVFFPRRELYAAIQEKYPEFEFIDIHKVFPNRIRIELTSYPIVANLRAYYILPDPKELEEEDFTELNKAIEELSSSNPNLNLIKDAPIIDESVTEAVFDLEPEDEPDKATEQKSLLNRIGQAIFDREENLELMTISVRGLSQPIENREVVISQENMDYLLDSIQYFANSIGLEIAAIDYLPVAREIHFKTRSNLIVWITMERGFEAQIDKLSTIYEAAELSKEDLAYIDLRIQEKVIYCPRYASCDQ